jgi:hypothetical protein
MNDDLIIQEVRRIRQEHAARFDYDLEAIFADLKKTERERDSRQSPLLVPPEPSEGTATPALHRTMGALRRARRR